MTCARVGVPTILLAVGLPGPLSAQQTPPIAPSQTPTALCFRARPAPDCSAFFLTNAGGYVSAGGGYRGIVDWGVMFNVSRRAAIGVSWFGTIDEDGGTTGPVARYRRWFAQGRSLDLAIGTPVASTGGGGTQALEAASILALAKYNLVDWFGFALRPEYLRYQPLSTLECNAKTGHTDCPASSWRLYAGVGFSGAAGLALSLSAGAALGALAILIASSMHRAVRGRAANTMIKKLALVTGGVSLALSIAASAVAQVEAPEPRMQLGPVAGVNIFTLGGSDALGRKWRTTFYAGGALTIPLGEHAFVQPELLYAGKGGSTSSHNSFVGNYQEEFTLTYLEVPLLFGYNSAAAGRTRLRIYAGPTWGLRLCGRCATSSSDSGRAPFSLFVRLSELSLTGGGGVGIPMGRGELSFDVRYTLGLKSIVAGGILKNQGFSVGAGYVRHRPSVAQARAERQPTSVLERQSRTALGFGVGAPEMLHVDYTTPVTEWASVEARAWGMFLICYAGAGVEAGLAGHRHASGKLWLLADARAGFAHSASGGGGICPGGAGVDVALLRLGLGLSVRGQRTEHRFALSMIFPSSSHFLAGDLTKNFVPSLTYTIYFYSGTGTRGT